MPPFSEPFETSLLHIPIVFFVLGFLFKIASLFTLRFFLQELSLCMLVLATSGIIGGFLSDPNIETHPILFSGLLFTHTEIVHLMVLIAVITSTICFLIHVLEFSHLGFRLLGLGWYSLLLYCVFAVADSDRETIGKYGEELVSVIPKIREPR